MGLCVQEGEEKFGTDKLYPNYKTVVKKSNSRICDLFPFSFFFKPEKKKKREARSHCRYSFCFLAPLELRVERSVRTVTFALGDKLGHCAVAFIE